jgi:hypothetical protein
MSQPGGILPVRRAKGWEDPGFRIGDLVDIGWWDADVMKANTHQIMHCCVTSGIAMTIREAPVTMALQLDGVIYSEGYNRETFLQTLDAVNDCVEKLHALGPRHAYTHPSNWVMTYWPGAKGKREREH